MSILDRKWWKDEVANNGAYYDINPTQREKAERDYRRSAKIYYIGIFALFTYYMIFGF